MPEFGQTVVEIASPEGVHVENGEASGLAVRADSPAQAAMQARYAVAEYLRDLGLRDPDLVARESHRIVERAEALVPAHALPDAALSEAAIELTVKQLDQWLLALSANSSGVEESDGLGSVVGGRLPDLLSRYPDALKQRRPPAEMVDSLRQDLTPVVPKSRPRGMRRQSLALLPSSLRRLLGRAERSAERVQPATTFSRNTGWRVVLVLLTLLSTVAATWWYGGIVANDGLGFLGLPLVILYALLFVWVAFSFWMATLGLVAVLRRPRRGIPQITHGNDATALPPTAILMPVYNEDPRSVFANLRAIAESLHAVGSDKAFSMFVLSDTTNADLWLEEERAWAKLVVDLPAELRVFYRHRPKNISRKSGNIADFCSRWGDRYKYMIVLDADSVMAGETLVEMVRRMERDPQVGILQVPPTPVNRHSFFARMQQFASHVYGPVFLEGFALWSQCDGNYWGHNAIIRVQPFMEHCDLPILPGQGPLSGEILSHDFVEAALMRRAGWKVCLAHDLDASYEECPTTMLAYAQRDQRWCQGNMQHIRLLLAEGFHPVSRLHFGMGAMSYLASPLWLVFLILTLAGAFLGGKSYVNGSGPPSGFLLFAVTMAMLLLPKLWGLIALSRRPRSSAAGGVWRRALPGVLLETLVSMLIAPIMMLLHTRFVISTLLGTKVKWNAQQRDDRGVSLRDALAVHFSHALFGLAVGGLVWAFAPGLLPWMSPIVLGLVLAIPLSMLLGSVKVGMALARAKLLLIPEEVAPPEVLKFQRDALRRAESRGAIVSKTTEPFASVLWDPAFYALHAGILRATHGEVPLPAEQLPALRDSIRAGGIKAIAADLRRAVLSDPRAMETLHVFTRSQLLPPQSPLLE